MASASWRWRQAEQKEIHDLVPRIVRNQGPGHLLIRGSHLTGVSQMSGSSRSSELFRQEFSVDNFLKPPTVFHTGLMDAPGPQFNGEFRSANVCKYVRSS